MITNWVEVVGILIAVLAALIGAFWKLISKASDNKSRFQRDLEAIKAIVVSKNVVPEIISLIERVEIQKGLRPGLSLEDIMSPSDSGFAYSLRRLLQSWNPIAEIERLYLEMVNCTFRCAYDMIGLATLPGITILWVFVDSFWEYFTPLVLLSGLIILIKAAFDVLSYTRTLHRFINKDNEIRLGKGVS